MAIVTGTPGGDFFLGGSDNDIIKGLGGNDVLLGGGGHDLIDGGDGHDILSGEAGNDLVVGGLGDDTLNGGSGNDTLIGGSGNDILMGDSGDDFLNALEGDDTMKGGQGNDRYIVNSIGDIVEELAEEGIDTVDSSIENYTLGVNVENLIMSGNALRGFGNELNNTMQGNQRNNALFGQAGDDILKGLGGDDILVGGAGNDILTGGEGRDVFRYDLNQVAVTGGREVDVITDFKTGVDAIVLSGIAPAGFSESQVTIVDDDLAAAVSQAQLIYSRSSGSLFFNENRGADGFGSGGQFAVVQGSLLTGADFRVLPTGATVSVPR